MKVMTTGKPIHVPRDQRCRVRFVSGMGLGDALMLTSAVRYLKLKRPLCTIHLVVPQSAASLLEGAFGVDVVEPFVARPAAGEPSERHRLSFDNRARVLRECSTATPASVTAFQFAGAGDAETIASLQGTSLSGDGLGVESSGVDTVVRVVSDATPYAGLAWGLALALAIVNKEDRGNDERNANDLALSRPHIAGTVLNAASRPAKPRILVNPIAANLARMMPLSILVRVMEALASRFPDGRLVVQRGGDSVIANSPQTVFAHEYTDALFRRLRIPNVEELAFGSLPSFVDHLKRCSLYLTVDTGLAHIAAARELSDLPSVVLFADIDTMSRWGFRGPGQRNLLIPKEAAAVPALVDAAASLLNGSRPDNGEVHDFR